MTWPTQTVSALPRRPTVKTLSATAAPPRQAVRATLASAVKLAWALLVFGLFLLAWVILALRFGPLVVPQPVSVWSRFTLAWNQGVYVPAFLTTLQEAALGWAIGALLGIPLGYLLGRFTALETGLSPYFAATQAMPIVAIAPLLVTWIGFGLEPKVVLAALIAFFPITTMTAAGIRGVERDLRDVARVFGATWWQRLLYLEIPRSVRYLFAGAKVAAALAVTGAVVGEFVSSNQGLGYLVNWGRENFDTRIVFVALISLMAMGAAAYLLITVLERIALRWTD